MDGWRRFLILLLPVLLLGAGVQSQHRAVLKKRGAAAPAPTYLLSEDFEAAPGYDTAGWTESGDPDEDSTTVVLDGSQSFRTDASENATHTITTSGTVYFYYIIRAVTTTAAAIHLRLRTGSTDRFHVQLLSTNLLRMTHGSVVATGATVLADNTTYHIWGRFQAGTGADGIGELYVSTTSTKPGTAEATITTGNTTASVNTVLIGSSSTDNFIIDKLRIDDVTIGSNPS